jgi:hypothetical protein
MCNQNLQIEGQKTQRQKEKGQKDKQWSIGYVYIITEGNSSRRSNNKIDTNNMATTKKKTTEYFSQTV